MRKTIEYILMILMGVQILFGAAFFVTNFGKAQRFSESSLLPFPAGITSLLQVLLAAVSLWYFLGVLGIGADKKIRGLFTAFLLTVPFLLQLHMARPAWSAAFSVFLWMLGGAIETGRGGFCLKSKTGLFSGISYFCYGVLCRDGLWLGGAVLLSVCLLYRKSMKRKKEYLLMIAGAACIIFAVNSALNGALPEKRQEFIENRIGAAAVSRFVWPNFSTNYYFWSDEVKRVMPLEEAVRIGQRVDLVESSFYPALEEAYGWQKADRLCFEMARRCFLDRTKETAAEILTDLRDYLLIPFTVEKNLKGEGSSLTAWNYGRMKMYTPGLAKYYYRYASYVLPFLLLGSILLWMFQRSAYIGAWVSGEGKWSGRIRPEAKLLLFITFFYTIWYTMRSNIPVDYKLVPQVVLCWYLAAAGGLACRKAES